MPASDPLLPARAALARRAFRDVIRLAQPLIEHGSPAARTGALRLCGEALLELGALPNALQAIQAALRLDPSHAATWHIAGRLFEAAGEPERAIDAHSQATRLEPGLSDAWLARSELHRTGGDLPRAAEVVQEGVLRNPARADLTLHLLEVLYLLGTYQLLDRAVQSALLRFPRHVGIRHAAARGRYMVGDIPAAMAHLDIALSIDPGDATVRALRAEYRMRGLDLAGALADVEHVLAREPGASHALLVRAQLRTRSSDYAGARVDLDRVLADGDRLPDQTLGRACVQRGLVFEAQRDYTRAYADLAAGQAALARASSTRDADGDTYLSDVRRRFDALEPDAPIWSAAATWPTEVPASWPLAATPPVFIFGFPRSGTTLCEHILGAHPALVATDERNVLGSTLKVVDRELGGRAVHALTDAEVIRLRSAFAEQARTLAPADQRVIDKVPLNLVHTALVRRVFPDAPIVFLYRDPRDCVWSAFVQAFSPNAAMINTTALDRTARMYATVLSVWQRARALPGLRLTELRYETIVADVQAGARALVDATGLPWHDDVADYRAHLQRQTVRTPSFAAITKPVTTTRIGRWRHFEAAMDPILPILDPFVADFGYAPAPVQP